MANRSSLNPRLTHAPTSGSSTPQTQGSATDPHPLSRASSSVGLVAPSALERLGIKQTLVTLAGVSLLTNVLLATALIAMSGRTQTILLPSILTPSTEAWVFTGEKPNTAYLSKMAADVLTRLTNVTPETVQKSHQILLKLTHPTLFGALERDLLREERQIIAGRLSTYFTPRRFVVYESELRVEVEGQFIVLANDTVSRSESRTFTLGFESVAGQLFLTELTQRESATKNAGKSAPNAPPS